MLQLGQLITGYVHKLSQTLHVWYIYLHWGGLRGQCRHIWQSHGVSGYHKLSSEKVETVLGPSNPGYFKAGTRCVGVSGITGFFLPEQHPLVGAPSAVQ